MGSINSRVLHGWWDLTLETLISVPNSAMTFPDRSEIFSPTQDAPLGATNRVPTRSECTKPSKRTFSDSPFRTVTELDLIAIQLKFRDVVRLNQPEIAILGSQKLSLRRNGVT